MKKTLCLLLLLTLILGATGQTYYLPKTAVCLHLTVERQTYIPGDFAHYAERYLRLTGIQQDEQVSHRVVSCDISTIGLRDTSKCYTLQLKAKSTPDVQLSSDGVLLAINAKPLATQPAARSLPAQAAATPKASSPRSYLSAEILATGSKAKMAELTARQILELRERRQQLATGEADETPQDEQQLRLMLQRIDQEHDALMTLFTGTTHRDTTLHTVTLCPEGEVSRNVAFRMSRRRGLVDKDDLSGVPYYISIKNLYPTTAQRPMLKNNEGLCANVPGMARLTLQQEDITLGTFDIPLAQFGTVELRDATVFKRAITHLQLHPATGAVVSLHSDEEAR